MDSPIYTDLLQLMDTMGLTQQVHMLNDNIMKHIGPIENVKLQLDIDSIMREVTGLWAEHLTHEQVKDMIAFYNSPTGKHLIVTMPILMKDAVRIGEHYAKMALIKAIMEARGVSELEAIRVLGMGNEVVN